jgi:hypothetical protein
VLRVARSWGIRPLSYREHDLWGRSLTADEAHEVAGMARRLTAIAMLQPAFDRNYKEIKAHAYP